MKPEAQPCPRQDSQQAKDALGRTAPKGDMAGSASPHGGFGGAFPDAGQVKLPTTGDNVPTSLSGAGLEAWCGNSMARLGGASVNRPS